MAHIPPVIEDENYDAPEPVLERHASSVRYGDHRRSQLDRGTIFFKDQNIRGAVVITVTVVILLVCIFGTKLENCGPDTRGLLWKAVYLKSAILFYLVLGSYLLNKRIINPALMALINVLIYLAMFGFYIYITCKLFSHENPCRQSFNLLLVGHIFLFLEALLSFGICCFISCTIAFAIICVFFVRSRMQYNPSNYAHVQIQRQDSNGGRISLNDLLLNAASLQLKPEEYRNMGECAICLEKFNENDQLIALPCHETHIFHPKCIADWSKQMEKCPLCKQRIDRKELESIQKDNSPLLAQNN